MTGRNTVENTAAKSKTYLYTTHAIIAAMLCIFAPMAVPIGPIPVSLTSLVLYFAIFVIGTKGTLISYIIYLLLGIAGLPVFSGYTGGIAKLAGPTGGYLIGFIPMIIIMGFIRQRFGKKDNMTGVVFTVTGMLLGTAAAYLTGTVWFVLQMDCSFGYAFSVCVLPFIGIDIAKMLIANALGRAVRKPLIKQGLIR